MEFTGSITTMGGVCNESATKSPTSESSSFHGSLDYLLCALERQAASSSDSNKSDDNNSAVRDSNQNCRQEMEGEDRERKAINVEKVNHVDIRRKIPYFPEQLMEMLSDEENSSVVAWTSKGDRFQILDTKAFETKTLPKHFKQHVKIDSFQRKLKRWGFRRHKKGVFYHEFFQKGRRDLLDCMNHNEYHNNASLNGGRQSKNIAPAQQMRVSASLIGNNTRTSNTPLASLESTQQQQQQQQHYQNLVASLQPLPVLPTLPPAHQLFSTTAINNRSAVPLLHPPQQRDILLTNNLYSLHPNPQRTPTPPFGTLTSEPDGSTTSPVSSLSGYSDEQLKQIIQNQQKQSIIQQHVIRQQQQKIMALGGVPENVVTNVAALLSGTNNEITNVNTLPARASFSLHNNNIQHTLSAGTKRTLKEVSCDSEHTISSYLRHMESMMSLQSSVSSNSSKSNKRPKSNITGASSILEDKLSCNESGKEEGGLQGAANNSAPAGIARSNTLTSPSTGESGRNADSESDGMVSSLSSSSTQGDQQQKAKNTSSSEKRESTHIVLNGSDEEHIQNQPKSRNNTKNTNRQVTAAEKECISAPPTRSNSDSGSNADNESDW